MTTKRWDFLFIGFLSVLILATFGRALSNGYVNWDDDVVIVTNQVIQLPFLSFLKAAFTHFFYSDYLPVTLMTFWTDFHIFGGNNPHVHHAINLILHCANVGILYFILPRYVPSKTWVYFLALVFAIHPVQTESVMWASSRNGLLCGLFALLAWRFHLKDDRSVKNSAFEVTFYVLSLLCKSMALFLPLFLFVLDWLIERKTLKVAFKRNFLALIFALAAVFIRIAAYNTGVSDFSGVAFNSERILLLPLIVSSALFLYWRMVMIPVGLSIIYPRYVLSAATTGEAIGFGILALAVIWLWRRSRGKEYIFFGALIVFFLGPVLQIIPRINFLNDRYLYFPVIGFAGLSVAVVRDLIRLATKKTVPLPWIKPALTVMTLVFSIVAFARSQVWSSNLSLWSDTAEKMPESSIAHNNLAMAEEKEGRISDAVSEYEKVLELGKADGTDNLAFNNLAIIYSRPDLPEFYDLKKSINYFETGIKRASKKDDTYTLRYNLAMAYLDRHDPGGALRILRNLAADLSTADSRYLQLLERTQNKMAQLQSAPAH